MSATTAPQGMSEVGLGRTGANHAALTPLSFLARAAAVYPRRTAIIDGEQQISYVEFAARCRRLAGALAGRGIGLGDTVAVLAPNVPVLLEAHYGVPMAGAVLNAINTRLEWQSVAFILDHGGAKLLIVDRQCAEVAQKALAAMARRPFVVAIGAPPGAGAPSVGDMSYESFLAGGDPNCVPPCPADEWQAIALNYTSGTTGNPKGVVYHHRGAYLNALGNILAWAMPHHPVYLWTLPMFHCNGWCFPWSVVALAGTHVCLQRAEPAAIFELIERHGVTHLCGAPVVLNMLAHAPPEVRRTLTRPVEIATGGAAPPSAVIAAVERMGFRVTHLYGLTETFGPAMLCAWQEGWSNLALEDRTARMARQGVGCLTLEAVRIVDASGGHDVPSDGQTIGEVWLRGNTVMKGYLKNPRATAEALAHGWLHTGDLAVRHADGYVEIKDRAKDIIISGGENISSLEIEEVLYRHPCVLEAAVVAQPDEIWGEHPCAFITLQPGARTVSAADIIAWCRDHLASFKAPKSVVFGPLPKTSTGKIQKFLLREQARALAPGEPAS
jgi:fatty-acyl-CoA synthase